MSRSIYNPLMPSIDFASRIARGGGGGGSGGGATEATTGAPPVRDEGKIVERRGSYFILDAEGNASQPYNTALDAYYANKGQSINPTTGEEITPYRTIVQEPVAEEPTRDTVEQPAAPVYTGPTFTTPSPVVTPTDQTPDAIPTDVSQDTVTQPVVAPTYGTQPVVPPTYTTGQEVFQPGYTGPVGQPGRRPIEAPETGIQPATPAPVAPRSNTGMISQPLQSATLSAVPSTVTTRPNYTGTTMANLTAPSQGVTGVQQVPYMNSRGQTLTVTEVNGAPLTYVPPGYIRAADQQAQMAAQPQAQPTMSNPSAISSNAAGIAGAMMGNLMFNEGGSVPDMKLDGMYRMATKFLGYTGPKTREALQAFRNSSPAVAAKMRGYDNAMARGGLMRKGYQAGGLEDGENALTIAEPPAPPSTVAGMTVDDLGAMSADVIQQTMQPRQAAVTLLTPDAADFIAPTAGQAAAQAPMAEAAKVEQVQLAEQPVMTPASLVQAATAAPQVQAETARLQAAQGAVRPEALVTAQQQAASAVSNLEAAQGTAIMMDNPVQREIQQGELISGVADATKAAEFTEQIQAAEATPTKQATVQGQLENLMTQFEGGQRPAWAAGAMRNAMATLAARGLGASSMAGQAVIQATMEAALPIAQADAATVAQFEAQNLSNRQQRAMLAAQQRAEFLGLEFNQAFQARVQNASRIADVANMNFTAEQQVALENSRIANTMNLQNLSNRQAMVIAEASALANLDLSNLNNRQQAAVQNAQNFLQMDMANLSNEQQASMFKSQQNIQALFTDQAAENAALQFNAASENQTNQFFASLRSQTSQFNAAQSNAMEQFNVNSVNAMRKFNSEVQAQREQFNAQQGLIVAQANAQWRQNIATINNAAINESNREFAQTMNNLTTKNVDNIWQRERDIMSYAVQTANNNADRATEVLMQKMANEAALSAEDAKKSAALAQAGGAILSSVVTSIIG